MVLSVTASGAARVPVQRQKEFWRKRGMNRLAVLVVDDEQMLRNLYQQRLQEEGHDVQTAAGYTEAAALIAKSSFDVVLTDLKMRGDKDGIRVLEAAKAEDEDVDVIIMTAFASVDTAIDAMRKGATDYLCKPIDFDELYLRLKQIAEKKEMARAFLSVEKNKAHGMLHLKDIAVRLYHKCQRAERILKKEDLSYKERVEKALKAVAR